MINNFDLENFGPLGKVVGKDLSSINLFIGANSSGKTFLLKAIYSAIKAHEESGRGDDKRDFSEFLSDKLYWTFQAEKLGDIVSKGAGKKLKLSMSLSDKSTLVYSLGQDTTKKVSPQHNNLSPRLANSVFLPPKEVLSLQNIILKSAIQEKTFGFDATYADLVLALKNPLQRGRNYNSFRESRTRLENMFAGRVEFDGNSDKWIYKRGNSKFSILTTAEGIKKIAILDTLLGNRFLTPESIIFIDEPESALHPTAITQLIDIIHILSQEGIQFFIASHSYYVIKKLLLIANKNNLAIPVFTGNSDGVWEQACLLDGMPDNEIINESIRLFEEEFSAESE
ncbi:MAG: AAA family ATPase [Mariprofundaceae bacterium]|nr:AAA family ATPase [Mariprofundaceae bacterium]